MGKKTKKPKPKQLSIAGTTERTGANKKIDAAAAPYVESKRDAADAKQEEKDRYEALVEVMRAEGSAEYVFVDDEGQKYRLRATSKTKVQVKKIKPKDADE